jgi:hypothetical protein
MARLGTKENPVVIEEGIYVLDEPSDYKEVKRVFGGFWAWALAAALGGTIVVNVIP